MTLCSTTYCQNLFEYVALLYSDVKSGEEPTFPWRLNLSEFCWRNVAIEQKLQRCGQ